MLAKQPCPFLNTTHRSTVPDPPTKQWHYIFRFLSMSISRPVLVLELVSQAEF